jgi:hypothetical protein
MRGRQDLQSGCCSIHVRYGHFALSAVSLIMQIMWMLLRWYTSRQYALSCVFGEFAHHEITHGQDH